MWIINSMWMFVVLSLTLQLNDLHPLSFLILTNKVETLCFKMVLQLRIHLKQHGMTIQDRFLRGKETLLL